MFKLLNIIVLTLLMCLAIKDSKREKQPHYVHLNNREVLIPLGDETIINCRKSTKCDTTLILNGLQVTAKRDSLDDVLELLEQTRSVDDLKIVGVISIDDARRLNVKLDDKENKLAVKE